MNHSATSRAVFTDIDPSSWSADGRFIAYTLAGAFPARQPMSGSFRCSVIANRFRWHKPSSLRRSGVFSPDGRWIAYTSNESGQPNVYVQPFLRAGGKYQVSRDGGSHPVWRADGKELFYLSAAGTMMAVPINATGQLEGGVPQTLFQPGTTVPQPRPSVCRDEGWRAIPGERGISSGPTWRRSRSSSTGRLRSRNSRKNAGARIRWAR